jgi:hypothetical protein
MAVWNNQAKQRFKCFTKELEDSPTKKIPLLFWSITQSTILVMSQNLRIENVWKGTTRYCISEFARQPHN